MATQSDTAAAVLDTAGRTFAHDAGIRLADTPSPLYRLLVLSVVLSTRIKTSIAVAAARELAAAGGRTPRGMLELTWQQRVDALGRAHYVRYDESTATALGEGAQLLRDEYRGDLRRMRQRADGSITELRRLLRQIPKLGPVGVDIFCREAQQPWPELRPYLDGKARDGATKLNLPDDAARLAGLVDDADLARFAAGLVRVSLDRAVADDVRDRLR